MQNVTGIAVHVTIFVAVQNFVRKNTKC